VLEIVIPNTMTAPNSRDAETRSRTMDNSVSAGSE
jgi:hypothetical protein